MWKYKIEYDPENDLIEDILNSRNISNYLEFLEPNFKHLIPLDSLKNIDIASEIALDGIRNNKRFGIYYDVDCDGISSGTIMYRYLQDLNISNIKYYINSGKNHGINIIDNKIDDIDILIIVDSLNNDYAFYDDLAKKGIKIIILDHHEFEEYPLNAVLVSSSKNYPNKYLSGSGVVFKFCYYLDTILKTGYSFKYLDLCAMGILADVSDVSESSLENRLLVHLGLKNLNNIAIKEMLSEYEFNSKSILWCIAPLVNSANRTKNNKLVLSLFLSDDHFECKKIIRELKKIKSKQDIVVENNYNEIKSNINTNNKAIFALVEDKEYTGLIATKISNEYKRPCIILHQNNGSYLTGSIRGYNTKSLKDDINNTKLAQCFGHDNASGITIHKNNIPQLFHILNDKYKDITITNDLTVDMLINIKYINTKLIRIVKKIGLISGHNFNPITIGINNVIIENITLIKDKHTKFTSNSIDFIFWNNSKLYNEVYYLESLETVISIDVVGELDLVEYRGKKVKQFIISNYKNVTQLPSIFA